VASYRQALGLWCIFIGRQDLVVGRLHFSNLRSFRKTAFPSSLTVRFTGSNNKYLETFITQLNIAFSLKDLGLLHYFLGIEVHRDASGMYLKQTKYIRDLLKKFNMEKASPFPITMVIGKQFTVKGELNANPTLYRQAISALQYLTNT